MNIQIKKLHPDAATPEYAHTSDAGADLRAIERVVLSSGEQKKISTGIALALPEGYACFIWDKSGIACNRQLKVMGGVIDAGYRGEIIVTLHNLGQEQQVFEPGDKIAQMIIQKVESPTFIESQKLVDGERKTAGFGSTGR